MAPFSLVCLITTLSFRAGASSVGVALQRLKTSGLWLRGQLYPGSSRMCRSNGCGLAPLSQTGTGCSVPFIQLSIWTNFSVFRRGFSQILLIIKFFPFFFLIWSPSPPHPPFSSTPPHNPWRSPPPVLGFPRAGHSERRGPREGHFDDGVHLRTEHYIRQGKARSGNLKNNNELGKDSLVAFQYLGYINGLIYHPRGRSRCSCLAYGIMPTDQSVSLSVVWYSVFTALLRQLFLEQTADSASADCEGDHKRLGRGEPGQ